MKKLTSIGARIRRFRERLGLTRIEFAPYLGISEQHLYKIETGKRNPTLATLYGLVEAFPDASEELRDALTPEAGHVPFNEAQGSLPADQQQILEKHDGFIKIYTRPEWDERGIPPEDFARIVSAIYLAFQRAGVLPLPSDE